MRMYFIAHEKLLAYAESNPGPLEQIFTKRTFFLWASQPTHLRCLLRHKSCTYKVNGLTPSFKALWNPHQAGRIPRLCAPSPEGANFIYWEFNDRIEPWNDQVFKVFFKFDNLNRFQFTLGQLVQKLQMFCKKQILLDTIKKCGWDSEKSECQDFKKDYEI